MTDNIGVVHSDFASMGKLANEYFHDIFSADTSLDAATLVDLLGAMVMPADNTKLCAPFTDEGISDTMIQIGPLKAPGPDGFPGPFF